MKKSTATTLFSLLLLCVFTSHLASASADFVVDTDGDLIQNGGLYYLLPVIRGNGGGIGRTTTGNETCPLTVVQLPSELSKGLPVSISSPLPILNIYESLIVNVRFPFVPPCSPIPSEWTVVKGLPLPEGFAVKLTGYDTTIPGWFQIQRAFTSSDFNDYKFEFCSPGSDFCRDIGIYIAHNGDRHLVANDQNKPLVVQFQKAASSTA